MKKNNLHPLLRKYLIEKLNFHSSYNNGDVFTTIKCVGNDETQTCRTYIYIYGEEAVEMTDERNKHCHFSLSPVYSS